jgi:hypothetical protein
VVDALAVALLLVLLLCSRVRLGANFVIMIVKLLQHLRLGGRQTEQPNARDKQKSRANRCS